ncbi:MAG: NAD(P)-binding domain-containing protein [Candidatus Gastranaerophilales bacterium]|nr:NAD(P)-binding domain-containing protein [Candidatus Gastranaerophilales bacterium]
MKIAFFALRKFDELELCNKFSSKYNIDFVWTSEYPSEKNLFLAQNCDAISVVPCKITKEFIDKFKEYGVKYILCRSIGYDHLPLDYVKSIGMKVSNVSYPSDCVADYAIMLMLMTTRKMNQIMLRSIAQDYSLRGKMGRDIRDCTIGIIGTGHIGSTVIKHLSGFDCKILAYNAFGENEELKKYARYVDLDTLYKNSDIISLHVSSNPDTFHMINENAINKMKDGVIIINTARGNLIESKSFINNIKSGKISAAGLDVIENENGLYYCNKSSEIIDNDELSMLRSFPNVVLTPHTAFYTETTVSNMVEKAFLALKHYKENTNNPCEIIL